MKPILPTRLLVFLLCFLFNTSLFAQNQNNQWRFGGGGAIDFNVTPPQSLSGSQIGTLEGSASVADETTGELLFYTDGVTIWDSTNQIMFNGNGLLGGSLSSSTSAAVIVPKPFNAGIYYVITIDDQATASGIFYNVVDMSLNGGLGGVVAGQKNIFLFATGSEKLQVVPTSDACGFWLVTHNNPGNTFYSFKITSTGIQTTPVLSTVGGSHGDGAGHLKINRQGNKLAMGNFLDATIELYDFNNTTGVLSNPVIWPFAGIPGVIYGVEFSTDGSKLYIANFNLVYQYDITSGIAASIQATSFVASVGVLASYNPGSLQLGPNGKIYIAAQGQIDAINFPNGAGSTCGFQLNAIPLVTSSLWGLPQYIYNVAAIPTDNKILASDTCFGNSTTLTVSKITNVVSLVWDFGDPASGANNIAVGSAPQHLFTKADTFQVSVLINYPCVSYTLTQDIIIANCPVPSITGIKIIGDTCNASTNFSLQAKGVSSSPYFFWNFDDPTSTPNDTITITGASPFPFPTHTFSAPGVYNVCVSFKEPGFPVSQVCRSIQIGLCCPPPIPSITNIAICDNLLPFVFNGNSYTATGSYNVNLLNSAGCDSIATLNLTVKPTKTSNTTVTICSNLAPYNWNGNPYSSSGIYNFTSVSSNGCDSVASLDLTVNDTTSSFIKDTACSNKPYIWNGNSYSTPGLYSITFINSKGCDSVATLNLTINIPTSSNTNLNICGSQLPLNWNGIDYFNAGTYTSTLVSAGGCDSIATLNLAVINSSSSITTESICTKNLPFIWNGNSYSSAGTYTVTLVNAAGCDSVARLELLPDFTGVAIFTKIDNCLDLPGEFVVYADSSIVSVTWNFGDPNSLGNNTSNLDSATHLFTAVGEYMVGVDIQFNCSSYQTSETVSVINCNECTLFLPDAFSPNNDNINDTFLPTISCDPETYEFSIFNRWGQLIYLSKEVEKPWDGKSNGTDVQDGIYIYQINYKFPGEQAKSKRGTVVLIK